jgi:Ca-activated chloride channel homolog
MLVASGTCLLLVLGQFRLDTKPQGTVVLAIDVSESMEATDVRPDRLTAAKTAATEFVDTLPEGFRVGVVTFAGSAQMPSAPSADPQRAMDAVEGLTASRGTVIGDGLAEGLDAIEADWDANGVRPAAVVLLSDGADTGSVVSPDEAAARAGELGVPVFTVAIVGPDPAESDKGSDAALLERIAAGTGGRASTASNAGELSAVYDALGTQLSSDLAVGTSAVPFLVGAAIFAVGAIALLLSRGRSEFGTRGR